MQTSKEANKLVTGLILCVVLEIGIGFALKLPSGARLAIERKKMIFSCHASFFFYPQDNDPRKDLGIEIMTPVLEDGYAHGIKGLPKSRSKFVDVCKQM